MQTPPHTNPSAGQYTYFTVASVSVLMTKTMRESKIITIAVGLPR
jgi:hypothetical protein